MQSDRELMQQVLDALEDYDGEWLRDGGQVSVGLAIKALRARLAQQEQEPFCYHDGRNIVGKDYADHSGVFPLYTAPPQRVWQRDGEKLSKKLKQLSGKAIFGASGKVINTDSAAYQELMAFIDEVAMGVDSPPSLQRVWQGLTDEEIKAEWLKVIDPNGGDEITALARGVERLIRSKNEQA